MPARALVTGCSGFVGSHLIEYLLANTDWQIDGMLRWRSPLDNMQSFIRDERVRFVYADLRDPLSLDAAVKYSRPQYVFHLAAQSFPLTSFSAPLDTYETNVQGTHSLLEALRQHAPGALIHVCSSSEVYGRVPMERLPIREDCPFHPASPYAISKVGTDLIARHYHEAYGMAIMVTRMGTHTGPRRGDVFAESSFAKQIAMIEAGMIPPVVKHGNLDSMRTIADVRDAVRAYHMLLTTNPKPGAVYNVAGSYVCKVGVVLEFLIGETYVLTKTDGRQTWLVGKQIRAEHDPSRMRPVDADNQVFDCSKFKGDTGWAPKIQFEKTMSDLLNYWRDRVKRYPTVQR